MENHFQQFLREKKTDWKNNLEFLKIIIDRIILICYSNFKKYQQFLVYFSAEIDGNIFSFWLRYEI